MIQYRIEWKNLLTNFTSNGGWYKSKILIQSSVIYMNEKYKGEIYHWIREMDTTKKIDLKK
jgi:hypothetical protein